MTSIRFTICAWGSVPFGLIKRFRRIGCGTWGGIDFQRDILQSKRVFRSSPLWSYFGSHFTKLLDCKQARARGKGLKQVRKSSRAHKMEKGESALVDEY